MARRNWMDRLPLGPIMAVAFAAALAFALYAMPGWLLARAVVASRLPDLLPAAEPPLGATARGLVMLVAAVIGGTAVWAMFRWIEGPPRPRRAEEPFVPAEEAPTLRRADAHPDAPARRPIFAAADLGAPLDEAPVMPWREETRRFAAVVSSPPPVAPATAPPIAGPSRSAGAEPQPELLLDERFEPAPLPDDAAELLARLEAGIARRGRMPAPDARLREGFARVANG